MKRILGIGLIAGVIGLLSFVGKDNFSEPEMLENEEAKGIVFQNISMEEAKKQALETGKLIFIDVHASWCGPCKLMAKGAFMDPKVAEMYNTKFINLKIDAEKDPDGEFVSRAYKVQAYPTLLFVDSKGKLVKNYVGMRRADELISMAKMVAGEK